MSAKNCLVLVYRNAADKDPYVVSCPKNTYFSHKDAQKMGSAHVRGEGMYRAVVVEAVMEVK